MCVAQSAVTAIQVQYGLGYNVDLLTDNDLRKFEQVWPTLSPEIQVLRLTLSARIFEQSSLYYSAFLSKGCPIRASVCDDIPTPELLGPGNIYAWNAWIPFRRGLWMSQSILEIERQSVHQPSMSLIFPVTNLLSSS